MISSGIRKFDSIDLKCSKCMCNASQPIVIPCSHRFCLNCIDKTIRNDSLNCPLCKLPFDSWLRLRTTYSLSSSTTTTKLSISAAAAADRQHKLDETLWSSIKKRFNDLLIAQSREHKHQQQQQKQSTSKSFISARPPLSSSVEYIARKTREQLKCDQINATDKTDISRGGVTDSINQEMTHFRPICLMPISIWNA